MALLARLICATTVTLLLGFPGLLLAADSCILTDEAEFSSYVNRLADSIGTKSEYLYVQGDEDTPERAFVRGAIGARSADLFMTVQFDRSGIVTDLDVQRLSNGLVSEVLVHLQDECLDPYAEDLEPLAGLIEKQVQFQIAQEEARKAKAGL